MTVLFPVKLSRGFHIMWFWWNECVFTVPFSLTIPFPPPLMILLQFLVPAMAVTPMLCAPWMMSMRRPLSGANTRTLPSSHAGREWNLFLAASYPQKIAMVQHRWYLNPISHWSAPLMMLWPSVMKSRALQVMLGTVMRSSSLGLSLCHSLISSSEQVANNSDVPLG